jgi:hypothetical protein
MVQRSLYLSMSALPFEPSLLHRALFYLLMKSVQWWDGRTGVLRLEFGFEFEHNDFK